MSDTEVLSINKEFLIAEALASLTGGVVGHGNDIVISPESSSPAEFYLDGGLLNKSVFTICVCGKDQQNVMSRLVICTGIALRYSGNDIVSSFVSDIGGKVSANGVWKYSCRFTALVRYAADDLY